MPTQLAVTKFESKSFNSPDEVRTPHKTRSEVVRLGDISLARLTLMPGWRWSECIKPVVKTDSCQATHVGYAISGRITVRMNDGTQKTIVAGDSYTIPPGHDGWVEGSEPFVGIELQSAEQYANPTRKL
jgi:hypothetical protein